MNLKYFITIVLIASVLHQTLKAQVISRFNWDANPPTAAAVGPNASSIGSSATTSTGGVGGTNGLNPGTPTADINLHIPNTGNIFDINNIDVSIDYRRNESTAQMVKRNTFTFNTGGGIANFRVTFRVNNGSGATTVTSTNVAIPQDAVFRNYRFTYDNCSGIGTMYVNNVVVWASPTPTANQNLYWVGEGDIVIGQDMDGASNKIVNLDNFVLQPYSCSILPVELLSFSGFNYGGKNILNWKTATEKNNAYFTLLKSTDGVKWQNIGKVSGAGDSHSLKTYHAEDTDPGNTLNYYRLAQTDHNGLEKLYSIISIDNGKTPVSVLKVTDFLGRELPADAEGLRIIYLSDGQVIKLTD